MVKQNFPSYEQVRGVIESALQEDFAVKDITTGLFSGTHRIVHAKLVAKQEGVIAGMAVVPLILKTLRRYAAADNILNKCGKETVVCYVRDGKRVASRKCIGEIIAPFGIVLSVERTILNFLQQLSGIATLTRLYVDALGKVNKKAKVYDTRKTTPGMRVLEKYAVTCGGGNNHRFHLADQVLIKDNHWELLPCEGFEKVKNRVFGLRKKKKVKVEIEVDKFSELQKVLEFRPDIIMLDNMDIHTVKRAVTIIRRFDKKIEIELSGNINLKRISVFRGLDIDRVSIGRITHSAPAMDISLDIV
ncbi:MAG: carboxylating nicotinate-nucleotide diphosphorylase [Elusimicrobiota bacterium]